MQDQTTSVSLRREITFTGLISIVFNGIIGAGIFALPAAIAVKAGHFSPWLFILCGMVILIVAHNFSTLAKYFDGTGGPILYTYTAFGSLVSFQTGWLLYLARSAAMAANTNVLIDYAAIITDIFDQTLVRNSSIILICISLIVVNILGVRNSIIMVIIAGFLKCIPLLILVILGLSHFQPELLLNAQVPAITGFSDTVLLLIYAFIGFESVAVTAGESKHPQKEIPRALISTIMGITFLYFLIQIVYVSVVPSTANPSSTPLVDCAIILMGPAGVLFIAIAAIVSIFGNISTIMLTVPRITYTMSKEKTLPNFFGIVHKVYQTPTWSIIILGVLSCILAISGTFIWLAKMSSLIRMLSYITTIATLPKIIKLYEKNITSGLLLKKLFLPTIGVSICFWIAIQANASAWLMVGLFFIIGCVLYYTKRYLLSKQENNVA